MERTRLNEMNDAPMPLPPGWSSRQSVPDPRNNEPARFYAVAPYTLGPLSERDERTAALDLTVTALDQDGLASKVWEQQHLYDTIVEGSPV